VKIHNSQNFLIEDVLTGNNGKITENDIISYYMSCTYIR